jgi:chromosome segregation ATPase
VLGTAFGYIRGYAKGLADAAERLARIETRADGLAVRTVKLETRVEGVENAQATEAASNRAERATSLRKLTDFASELEQVKQSTPKIQGLPKK